MSKKSIVVKVSIYYALLFMGSAGFSSYIGLYYSSIKLNNTQIGLIASIGSIAGLLFQPIWGTLSDKVQNKNTILQMALFLSAFAIWLLPLSGKNFWLIVAATTVLGMVGNCISPLGDSITIELANQENFKFSMIRTVGSLAFALMSAVAGQIFAVNIRYIFPLFFFFRFIAALNVFFLPTVPGQHRAETHAGFLTLFRDPKLVYMYIYIFILCCTFGFFNSFHAIYSRELGITTNLIGLGIMIGSLSQFPFMMYFHRIYQKLGINNLLLGSGLVYVLRWILYFTALTPATILFIWALHVFNYMPLYLGITEYVSHSVPPELRTRGQVMNAIILGGISSIVGSFFGGWASSILGLQSTFGLAAILCGVAVLGFLVVTKFTAVFRETPLPQTTLTD